MDNKFLEEYIHLEKICGEMYGTKYGVSAYIDEMTSTDLYIQNRVPGWKETLKMLKDLRWKRNQYAHEGVVLYEDEDIEKLARFYEKIMNGEDPLSEKRKILSKKIPSPKGASKQTEAILDEPSEQSLIGVVLVGIAVVVFIVGCAMWRMLM